MDDFFATIKSVNIPQKDPASYRGKQITLHKTAKELRYFVRKYTRQLEYATYSDAPIRNDYVPSKIKWCVQYGEATLTPYLVRKFAVQANYDVSKFKMQLEKHLMRKITLHEAHEFVVQAGKQKNSTTIAGKRIEIDQRAKVYVR